MSLTLFEEMFVFDVIAPYKFLNFCLFWSLLHSIITVYRIYSDVF